eukprot:Clim_evm48s128 gene=Clim_evmTU48s128
MVKRVELVFEGANYMRQRLVLSMLSGKSIRIEKIRYRDADPGVQDFEASFLRLLDKLSNGTAIEINESGTVLTFTPGAITGGDIEHDCNVARSIGYYLEPIVPILVFAKKFTSLTLRGVTNNEEDPSVDLLRTVTLQTLKDWGIDEAITFKIVRRGAPPLGGGEVSVVIPNIRELKPIRRLDEGKIKKVRGIAYATRVSPHTGNRMVDGARGVINPYLPDVYIYTDHYRGADSGKSPGYSISLVAESTTGALYGVEVCGNSKTVPEKIGEMAAEHLLQEIARGGVYDTQNQAMAVILMAMSTADVSKIVLGPLSPYW